jgi:hypothetical protein
MLRNVSERRRRRSLVTRKAIESGETDSVKTVTVALAAKNANAELPKAMKDHPLSS